MNKFQKVNFKGIDDFLEYLPGEELAIVQVLRTLVRSTLPIYEERLAYNVPFYYRNSRICFIWPSSVPWGNLESGVAFGFCSADRLPNIQGFFQNKARKSISRKVFYSLEELNNDSIDQLRFLLQEAYLIDQKVRS